MATHPLCNTDVKEAIERATSEHLGRRWTSHSFTDLNDLATHQSGIFHDEPFSVFAKIATDARGAERFRAELAGLTLLRDEAHVPTPRPIGTGLITLDHGSLLLFEALSERRPETRTSDDWRSIGFSLARIHQVHNARFGLQRFNGFYGPLPQNNSPVGSNRWVDFFIERRVLPMQRAAIDSGHLALEMAHGVDTVVQRLPLLCGPEPQPTLLHGDAQQHNFVSADSGAAIIDPAPYFGHPEMDLAQVDVYNSVPADVFDAYREVLPIDPGFEDRRELWRLFCYLAAMSVHSTSPFGRRMLKSLADAVDRYK